ncbi:unannotated protein [freshwater metagenome]|uniref:Unannotated protein n=1 Tax=freshwater metagenome TaxID=449393 RepID=A0A6J7IX20_9ZZZZ|nr:CBS domain-containing protein [Actinomycetota bacterium]
MHQFVNEIMSTDLHTCETSAPLAEAAQMMRDCDVGAVLAMEDGSCCGILTDRDIVVRGLATGGELEMLHVGDLCTTEVATLGPEDSIDRAVEMVRQRGIRRIPVMDHGKPVGMVSIGDLAIDRDPGSALGQISAAPATH